MDPPKPQEQSGRNCESERSACTPELVLNHHFSKYGNVHKQLRALTILDGLIENAGSRFQRAFADEPLLERLRVAASDSLSDPEVKKKCQILFRQWAVDYKSTPGLERIAALSKQLPQRKKPPRQEQSKVLKETEPGPDTNEDPFSSNDDSVSGKGKLEKPVRLPTGMPSSSNSASLSSGFSMSSASKPSKNKLDKQSKKAKLKQFNLEKEKPQLLQTIATSSVASTNLMNALKLINRENKRVSEDSEALKSFETCKLLRRQILRYIQYVESEHWLGSLIHANEELVTALMTFEVLDKSLEDDSDSDDKEWNDHAPSEAVSPRGKSVKEAFVGLSLGDPPRNEPAKMAINSQAGASDDDEGGDTLSEDENSEDPFADSHAVHTPKNERPGLTW